MKRIKTLLGIVMIAGFMLILSGASKTDINILDTEVAMKNVVSGSVLLIFGIGLRLYFDRYIARKRRNAVKLVKVTKKKTEVVCQTQSTVQRRKKNFVIPEVV